MKTLPRSRGLTCGWLLLLCAACEGHIGGADRSGSPGVGGSVAAVGGSQGGGAGQLACDAAASSATVTARVRRLTEPEYVSTLRALVGDAVALPVAEFPPDAALGTFHNAAALLRVTDLLAQELAGAAQELAAQLTESLPALLGCDPQPGDDLACVQAFLARFGAQAYRRPLASAELQRLVGVYQAGSANTDVRAGVALCLEVILQSPHLLYRTELGAREAADPDVELTGDELASQLSYLVTLAPPDDELTRAAAQGELVDANKREAQARRLLQQPGAHAALAKFASEWLDIEKLPTLSKDPAMFPAFSPDAARAQVRETEARFVSAILTGDGKLRSLLTSGLLTEPSVLAAHAGTQWSSPTHRGKMIRNQFLCQAVPPPPPGLIVTVPPAVPGATTRQRMATHASDPGCSGCHGQMDPLGFAFEHYDAVGQYRETEAGLTIDTSGQISGDTDADGPFDGSEALSARLAESADARACFAEQWTTFALGAELSQPLACALEQELGAFRAERSSLPELMLSLIRSASFSKRHVSAP